MPICAQVCAQIEARGLFEGSSLAAHRHAMETLEERLVGFVRLCNSAALGSAASEEAGEARPESAHESTSEEEDDDTGRRGGELRGEGGGRGAGAAAAAQSAVPLPRADLLFDGCRLRTVQHADIY